MIIGYPDKDNLEFANLLLSSLPADAELEIVPGGARDPLDDDDFYSFAAQLKWPWELKTSATGWSVIALSNREKLTLCKRVICTFKPEFGQGLYPWLGRLARLEWAGYDIVARVPQKVNRNYFKSLGRTVNMLIEIADEAISPTRGVTSHKWHSCSGEAACIWSNGKYYPCYWCAVGTINPVYSYGKLGELFERQGKEKCHLRWCPSAEGE